jgi:uncharacterized protein (DUF58 family)
MTLAMSEAPSLNRLPLALVAAAVVSLVCGVFVHANGYVWLAATLVVLLVGAVWPWVVVRTSSATLHFASERGREGEPAAAMLDVRSRLPWKLSGLRLQGDVSMERDVAVGGNDVRWTPTRFGPVAGQLVLTCDRPFGLWTARRSIEVPRPMIVWPRTHKVGPVPDVVGDALGTHAGRRVGSGSEFCGVREFRAGDRLRLVHWPQSARHDRLVVRETLADATPKVRVGLVLGRDAHADAAAFDEAVRDAASKVEGWTRAGSVVELVLPERRVACPPNAVPRAALDALAQLRFEDLPGKSTGLAGVDVLATRHDRQGERSRNAMSGRTTADISFADHSPSRSRLVADVALQEGDANAA